MAGNWDREVDEKSAEYNLLDAVSSFKNAGVPMWYVIKLLARFWDHIHEERDRLHKWTC